MLSKVSESPDTIDWQKPCLIPDGNYRGALNNDTTMLLRIACAGIRAKLLRQMIRVQG